ncbi:MAG: chemotaxis protein CheX [Desulfobacteraceae bacterium]|nr:chemotaxis protein CheX [Desulfobacteraceae bacterium]
MMTNLKIQVVNSIFEVMETMFFLAAEEQQKSSSKDSALFEFSDLKACCIDFSGGFSGKIYLVAPLALLRLMTEYFLGEKGDNLTDEHIDGTFTEALNMIAGNALRKLDDQPYMGLGLPKLVDPSQVMNIEDYAFFNTVDGPMASFFELTSPDENHKK